MPPPMVPEPRTATLVIAAPVGIIRMWVCEFVSMWVGRSATAETLTHPHTHLRSYKSGRSQSTRRFPAARKAALIFENGRLPKKPDRADRGEGCADSTMMWRPV